MKPPKRKWIPPAAGIGRKKGVPNRITRDAREAFRQLVEGNADKFQSWLDRVARRSPGKALLITARLSEFFVAKPSGADLANGAISAEDFASFKATLIRVLSAFPEAKAAVVAAFDQRMLPANGVLVESRRVEALDRSDDRPDTQSAPEAPTGAYKRSQGDGKDS